MTPGPLDPLARYSSHVMNSEAAPLARRTGSKAIGWVALGLAGLALGLAIAAFATIQSHTFRAADCGPSFALTYHYLSAVGMRLSGWAAVLGGVAIVAGLLALVRRAPSLLGVAPIALGLAVNIASLYTLTHFSFTSVINVIC